MSILLWMFEWSSKSDFRTQACQLHSICSFVYTVYGVCSLVTYAAKLALLSLNYHSWSAFLVCVSSSRCRLWICYAIILRLTLFLHRGFLAVDCCLELLLVWALECRHAMIVDWFFTSLRFAFQVELDSLTILPSFKLSMICWCYEPIPAQVHGVLARCHANYQTRTESLLFFDLDAQLCPEVEASYVWESILQVSCDDWWS